MSEDRVFLATIDHEESGDRVDISVTVGYGDETHRGLASGSSESSHRARLVGEATLRAVESIVDRHFDLSAVGTTELGPVRVALVQVREAGWSDYLIGSALLRDGDIGSATAKAILDALNRRISMTQRGTG